MKPLQPFVVAVAGALAAGAYPQVPEDWQQLAHGHRLRTVAIADATATAIVVAWPHAFAADAGAERAIAQAVADFRAERAAAALPAKAGSGAEVLDGATLYHAVLPAGAPADAVGRWFAALTAPADAARDGDRLQLAAARAALTADDAEAFVPGLALASRARRQLAAGTVSGCSVRGDPAAVQRLLPAELAAAVGAPPGGPCAAVVLGDPALGKALAACLSALPPSPAAAGPGGMGQRARAEAGPPVSVNDRLDAPYACVALAAPPASPQSLPFALAIEVLRLRAQRQFGKYRRGEVAAAAPFVEYSFLTGAPVALLFRRGSNGAPLSQPQSELQGLLAGVRQQPITAAEAGTAAQVLAAEWSVPPWSPAQVQALRLYAAGLLPRARALLLLGRCGVDDAAVAALDRQPLASVQKALDGAFAEDGQLWLGLVPTPPAAPPDKSPDKSIGKE